MIKAIIIGLLILLVIFFTWCLMRMSSISDARYDKSLQEYMNTQNESHILSDLEKETVSKLVSEFDKAMDKKEVLN